MPTPHHAGPTRECRWGATFAQGELDQTDWLCLSETLMKRILGLGRLRPRGPRRGGDEFVLAAIAQTCGGSRRWSPGRHPLSPAADKVLGFLHDLVSVGRQFQKYGLGDRFALLGRNPFVVQVRSAIALGIFDKCRVNGIRNELFDRVIRHSASCLSPSIA